MKKENIYAEIFQQADPIIKHYRDDLLKHDKNSIMEDKHNTPFLHFTGDTGTTLQFLYTMEEYPEKGAFVPYLFGAVNREGLLESVLSIVEGIRRVNRRDLVLFYNGRSVKKIDLPRAIEIAQEYTKKTVSLWEAR